MRLGTTFLGSLMCVTTAAFAAPITGVAVHECAPGQPTAASYTWNFKNEANTLFQQIRDDAQVALDHADQLKTYERNQQVSWPTDVSQLNPLKREVNDMSRKLCRLQVIRRVTAPWQQAEIDRISKIVRLMADNTAGAILYGNDHRMTLWLPQYRTYTSNLYKEAESLTHSVDNAVAYAKAMEDYQHLKAEMATGASS